MVHPTIAVLIVDDNRTFADAMRFAIDREDGLRCVGIAGSGTSAIDAVLLHDPDHVLVNVDVDVDRGLETVRSIRATADSTAVTVLSSRTDAEAVMGAEAAGAHHFVPKQSSIVDVLDALRSPSNGSMTLPGTLLVDLLGHQYAGGSEKIDVEGLTARELDVLRQMAHGAPPKVIARAMGISVHTVRGHVKNIYWKLDAHSQLEAVAIAGRRGLIGA